MKNRLDFAAVRRGRGNMRARMSWDEENESQDGLG